MALTQLDFENQTSGTAVPNGGTGADFGVASPGTGGSITYDNTHAAHGAIAVKFSPAASQSCYTGLTSLNTAQLAIELPVWFDTATDADTWPIYLQDTAAVGICRAYLESTGKLRVSVQAGQIVWTATQAFPLGQWVRISLYISITTGTLKVSYFLGDSTAPVEAGYVSANGVALGSVNIGSIHLGKANGSDYVSPFWIDSLQYDTAASDFIGPWPADAPAGSSAYVRSGGQWVAVAPYVYDGSSWSEYDFVS